MFQQVIDNMRRATDATVQMQQEMFNKWMGLWPGTLASAPMWGQAVPFQQVQARWAETMSDLLKRQRELYETTYKSGQQNIEKAFQLGEVKSPEEMRAKSLELWRTCMESLRETNEAQMRELQAATDKWLELLSKPVA